MRISALLAMLLTGLMIFLPLYLYGDAPAVPQASEPSGVSTGSASWEEDPAPELQEFQRPAAQLPMEEPLSDLTSFRIYNRSTGQVEEVSVQDYVRGAVAAEMPATFHSEAMKAQAVSAHTYAIYQHYSQLENPNPDLHGADFAADPQNLKGYATEADMRERWGEMGDVYWDKVTQAADSVMHYVMVYEGEPIIAAYHAACAGETEGAENVWSSAVPYLVPVDSPGDLLAPNVRTTTAFTTEEVRKKLTDAFPDLQLPQDRSQWFVILERSESGYILQMDVGNLTLHGKDVRTALGLKSTCMEIAVTEEGFVFTTTGYGHGVGLSQYGADYFARQGKTFDEILTYYYTGAELAQLD